MKNQYRKLELRSNCCGICLEANSSITGLQDLQEISFNNVPAIDALNQMFNLKITTVELLSVDIPRKMCLSCREDVAESFELWTLAWHTQRKIDDLKRNYQDEVSKVFEDLSSTSDEDDVVCTKEEKPTLLVETKPEQRNEGSSMRERDNKKLNINKDRKVMQRKFIAPTQKPVKECPTCGILLLATSLKKHMAFHSSRKDFSCAICGFEAPRKDYLIRHIHIKHPTISNAEASVIYNNNTTLNNVNIPRKTKLPKKIDKPLTVRQKCEDANKRPNVVLKNPVKRIADTVDMKHRNRPFGCDICGKCYTTKANLEYHLKSHFNILDFPCSQCTKAFKSKYLLASHMRTHNKIPFKCAVCQAKFSSSFHLTRHLTVHTEEKPKHEVKEETKIKSFPCQLCGYMSKNKIGLDMHLYSVHKIGEYIKREECTKPRSYQCDYCPKDFSKPQYLKVHTRTHTNEKPYSCLECQMRFTTKSTLNCHYRKHTGEKPFECGVCPKRFSNRSNLRRHEMTH